ncbi:MAG TPA: DJ-1/PfpI family protein, partial [Spirochaetes bacterium]|nr:DJ-1/PfpI family protein [Spirochaetota bacterium]
MMIQTKKRTSIIFLGILLTFGILSCTAVEGQNKGSQKVIGIIVYDGVLTSDVTAPYEVFGAAIKQGNFPYKVINISIHEKKEITTYEGLKLFAESNISDAPDLDVLIVPSTYDMKPLVNNAKLVSFIKKQGSRVTWLASNCAGAFLLGKAGFLD